jgi:hypothetical protein
MMFPAVVTLRYKDPSRPLPFRERVFHPHVPGKDVLHRGHLHGRPHPRHRGAPDEVSAAAPGVKRLAGAATPAVRGGAG